MVCAVFIVVISILHFLDPTSYAHVMVTLKVVSNHFQLTNFVDDALRAMEAVLYVIFIKPILWILTQISTVINFLSKGIVTNKVLFATKGTYWNVPAVFWILFGISVALIIILLVIKMLVIMQARYNKQGILFRTTLINFTTAVIVILLIPLVFIVANFLVTSLTQFLLANANPHNVNIGLWIFNASFNNGFHHFTAVPDHFNFPDSNHFNYLIALFSEGFMIYVLFVIALTLFSRIFELLILYCTAPLVVGSLVSDTSGSYQIMRNWTSITLQRFALFFFIFLAYDSFLASIVLFSSIANLVPQETARPIFVLIGIFGAALVVIKAPSILNSLIGGQASILDSVSHLSNLKSTTGAIMAGGGLAVGAGMKLLEKGSTLVSAGSLGVAYASAEGTKAVFGAGTKTFSRPENSRFAPHSSSSSPSDLGAKINATLKQHAAEENNLNNF